MFKSKNGMSRALVRRETTAGYLFLLPSLFFFVTFVLYPMFLCIYTSFFDSNMGKNAVDVFVGLGNYKELFQDKLFLGALKNTVVIVIVGQLGYVAAVSGLVMVICTLKGYEMLGKKLGTPGIIISCVLMLLMIFLAYQADWSITAAQFYETDFFTAFRAMMDLIKEGYVDSGDYFGGLAQVYLFAVIGAVPTIIAMAKGAKHMVTTAKMRSAYAPVSAPAAASVQMPVQPASSPTAPQNVEKDIEK